MALVNAGDGVSRYLRCNQVFCISIYSSIVITMAYEGELTIENKTYNVIRACLMVTRAQDMRGRPYSPPTWRMFLLLDADNDSTLTNWMFDPIKQVAGTLELRRQGEGSIVKKIRFSNTHCFRMRDYFNASESFSSTFIGISGQKISIDDVELDQNWLSRKK